MPGSKEPRTKMPRTKEVIQTKTKDQRKNTKNHCLRRKEEIQNN
jgi:hypothetical protein